MISTQFANLLAAGRPEFNRRVAEARRRHPAFDTALFGEFLSAAADAVVCAAAAHTPDRAGAVAMAAYDLALDLTVHNQTGALTRQVWNELAPQYAALLVQQPSAVLAMLTNAVLHLRKNRSARVGDWLGGMAQLARQLGSVEQLSVVGQICAWRAGMAHFRQGAIAAAEQLPEALALAAFGAEGSDWPTVRDSLLRDPWWTPDAEARRRIESGIEIGSFVGLGGEFSEPPSIRPAEHGFWIRSGERHLLLMVDVCGAVLHPATEEEYTYAMPPIVAASVSLAGQRLTLNGRTTELDLPASHLQVVCNAHAAAIASPYSHAIRVLPLR